MARIMAGEVADATCITELNAKAVSVAEIREEFRKLRCRALFGKPYWD